MKGRYSAKNRIKRQDIAT